MELEGGKPYELDSGISVEVRSAEFKPRNERGRELRDAPQDRAVILIPGWGNSRLLTMNELSQAFADNAGSRTFLVTARSLEQENKTTEATPDFLYEEARAISRFIKERGLKQITLTGHSQGADRAINIASILQDDPDIKIDGLVLIGPTGLYEQNPVELGKAFATHVVGVPFVRPDIPRIAKQVENASQAGAPYIHDVARNEKDRKTPEQRTAAEISKEGMWDGILSNLGMVGRSLYKPGALIRRISSEIKEMAKKNPRAEKIRAPITIIAGAGDPVADRERIVPSKPEQEVRTEMGETLERRKDLAARERILKENVFPSSPYIRMVVPGSEKLGNHLVQIFRPDAVAKVSLYLLRRYARETTKAPL